MNLHLLSQSAFQPEDLDELKKAFDRITSQSWFDKNRKHELSKFLFKTYSDAENHDEWRAAIEPAARKYFRHQT